MGKKEAFQGRGSSSPSGADIIAIRSRLDLAILPDEIPDVDVTVLSRSSPHLAAGLMRGRIDLWRYATSPKTPSQKR